MYCRFIVLASFPVLLNTSVCISSFSFFSRANCRLIFFMLSKKPDNKTSYPFSRVKNTPGPDAPVAGRSFKQKKSFARFEESKSEEKTNPLVLADQNFLLKKLEGLK